MVKRMKSAVVVVSAMTATAYADATVVSPEAPAAKASYFAFLLGGEVAVKPSVYNGEAEGTVHTETVSSGIDLAGAKQRHESWLFEWSATARLKAGSGLPADTFRPDERIAAVGIQLAGRVDYGLLPMGAGCGVLHVSAGTGTELKGTAMSPSSEGAHDSLSLSTPDGQAYGYARVGAGVACVRDGMIAVASPFVAWRSDTVATAKGYELGARAAIHLTANATALVEAATMSTSDAASSDRTTRASLTVRKFLGRKLVLGADATVTRNNLDYTAEPAYRKRITPYAVTLFAAMAL